MQNKKIKFEYSIKDIRKEKTEQIKVLKKLVKQLEMSLRIDRALEKNILVELPTKK